MNSFGQIFRLTSFGESHGEAIGGVIDGCPAGLHIDLSFIQEQLDRRKPGQSKITTPRKEDDKVEFLSGIFNDITEGTPIGFIIRNTNQNPGDYDTLKDVFRPSHADYTYATKYGNRDYRGGGRSSARETVARVVAGSVAKLFLKENNIEVKAFVSRVGTVELKKNYKELDLNLTDSNMVRCPDSETAQKMIDAIIAAHYASDTLGGIIQCVITGVPVGLGGPVYNKLHADLGRAMLSINAVKGFEYGAGFEGTWHTGYDQNDVFIKTDSGIRTKTNNSGGIQGGISNGEDIYFNVAFKPISTLLREQNTVNSKGEEIVIHPEGRHDTCVLPRAVPIVDSMAAMVIADHFLMRRLDKI